MFRLKGIHHLAMATGDMNGTIRFWRDLLGLRLVAGIGRKGYKLYFFEISPQNYIVFFEWPEVQPVPEKDHGRPVIGPMIFDHVAFAAENDESLWALRERLESAGFWVSDMVDHGIMHSIYSFDPNGIPLEFSARVEGIDIGADPKLVDTDPVAAALEGSEPVQGIWPESRQVSNLHERFVYPGEGGELVSGAMKNWWDRK